MIDASVHVNGDDAFLAWRMPLTPDCLGVAIHRRVLRGGAVVSEGLLENRVGFKADDPRPGETRPSSEWPFQRYTWTDHGVGEGDEVTYRISPVMLRTGTREVDDANAATVAPVPVTATVPGGAAYFNRGVVLSQFMLRHLPPGWSSSPLPDKRAALKRLTESLRADSSELRRFLMGDLGAALSRLLADELAAGSEVHAALYEVSDATLIEALARFGPRAHVVLANGSSKNSRDPRTPTPYVDGNADAAHALEPAIDLRRRMFFTSQGLGHNKFLVVSRGGRPKAVWTGSTNWATTGLCTQANNAVLLEDPGLAAVYLAQWQRLADDNQPVPHREVVAPTFGPALTAGNDQAHESSNGGIRSRVWFTRTSSGAEIDEVVDLIDGAEHAVFFLLFEPGTSSRVVAAITARLGDRDVHVHGVINTIKSGAPRTPERGNEVEVAVVAPGSPPDPFRLEIVQPEGVEDDLTSWATEVTRQDFVIGSGGVIGHAIVHSKAIVLDPFTNPVVITGSHNFSQRASTHNDENLLIRSGDAAMAERYAVHIMGVYQHYRWRKYLKDARAHRRSPFDSLRPDAGWQSKLTDARQRELSVWL
jgi:hypothetical protein